jgi:hypothetical protein
VIELDLDILQMSKWFYFVREKPNFLWQRQWQDHGNA